MRETVRFGHSLHHDAIMMLIINLGTVRTVVRRGDGARVYQVGQVLYFINYLMEMLASLMMVGMLLMRIAAPMPPPSGLWCSIPAERADAPDARPLPSITGRVQFDHVSFSYDGDGGEPVLRDVGFTVEPGETVAIIGATGSGKSTLVHLIPRLYDATAGRVLVDGHDVRTVRQDDLRRVTATVLQETVLFHRHDPRQHPLRPPRGR